MRKLGRAIVQPRPIVAGPKDVVRAEAVFSNVADRGIVSPKLAKTLGLKPEGRSCVLAGVLGRHCGPTAPVEVAFDGCVVREVKAIVSRNRMPPGANMIVGTDLVRGRKVKFDKRGATVVCPAPTTRRRPD
jgi:hypothetical protein